MSFGQFLLYYLASAFIGQLLLVGVYAGRVMYQQRKLKQDVASGKIKFTTMEELLEQIGQDGDKKTWN